MKKKKEKCSGNCGMNYCDENGCVERKRILVEPCDQKSETLQSKGKTKTAKKLLFENMKKEGWEEILFAEGNPNEDSAVLNIVLESMEEYAQSHANQDGSPEFKEGENKP